MSAPLLALACLWLAAPAAKARAEEPAAGAPPTIYKWVDANGVAHYTTELGRVPRSVRGSVRALGGGSTPAAESDVVHTPAPAEATAPIAPAEPPPEWDVGDAPPPGTAPAPAPAPVRGKERWAETDRPFDAAPGDTPAPGEAPAEPGQPTAVTASAEPTLNAADAAGLRRDLDARIAGLEQEIAADEDSLKSFLAVAGPQDPAQVAYDESFREVAERLPKRLAELRSLQSERAQLDSR